MTAAWRSRCRGTRTGGIRKEHECKRLSTPTEVLAIQIQTAALPLLLIAASVSAGRTQHEIKLHGNNRAVCETGRSDRAHSSIDFRVQSRSEPHTTRGCSCISNLRDNLVVRMELGAPKHCCKMDRHLARGIFGVRSESDCYWHRSWNWTSGALAVPPGSAILAL